MTDEKERIYYAFLSKMVHFAPEKLREAVELLGGPEAFYEAGPEGLFSEGIPLTPSETRDFTENQNLDGLRRETESWAEKGIRFVTEKDPEFPSHLRGFPDAPFGLYYRGTLPSDEKPSAGIVGARLCTDYGREMAFYFGRELSKANVSVVSGMALGIDGFAGRGAISEGRNSYAVLGGGADICYPRENVQLYTELCEKGGVISERPPGHKSMPYDFPVRNRIIAGLSDVLVIIEAAPNSGSMITARYALAQGKEVFALPGRVGDRMSEGCNLLIRDGAQMLLSTADLFGVLGIRGGKDRVQSEKVKCTPEEKSVLRFVNFDPVSVETLMQKTGFPVSVLSGLLISLEIKGFVKRGGIGGYTLVR